MARSIKIPNKQNVGNAGEYYIASQLSVRNFIATITLGRAEKYDIMALSPKGKTIKISVKTRYKTEDRFPLREKDEKGGSKDFFYAFILLNEMLSEPDVWIVPSKDVNRILKRSSDMYFNQLRRKDGGKHKDVGLRNFWVKLTKTSRRLYPKNWETTLKKKYYENYKQLG